MAARRALSLLGLATAGALAAGTPAAGQVTVTLQCPPALPGEPVCPTIRAVFTASAATELAQFSITAPRPVFAASGPGVGTFTGLDATGSVAGPTTVANLGQHLFVDFLASIGRTFDVGTDPAGYVFDVASIPGSVLAGEVENGELHFIPIFTCEAGPGGLCPPEIIPEPGGLVLLGTGLAAVAVAGGVRRRRHRSG